MTSTSSTAGTSKGKPASSSSSGSPKSKSKPKSDGLSSSSKYLFGLVYLGVVLYAISTFGYTAYTIRLHAINEYGRVIHEFDPWFNFRATQYLHDNGVKKFFTWFDYKVWYPLGRPVGTTIYPGMQFTAVFIKRHLLQNVMSLNDVCCLMPAWFGAAASFITGLMAYECSRDDNASTTIIGVFLDGLFSKRRAGRPSVAPRPKKHSPAVEVGIAAMAIMAMVPAHLMRSVGGGYDNESVAFTAMTLTFYMWCRSLRASDPYSHYFGILTGIAYFYMVAVWGGYVFVLNLIGVHAAILFLLGRFSTKIYMSYSFFYVVGTSLAIQVPVVGWTPLKSLEQLGPCAVFCAYQLLQLVEVLAKRRKLNRIGTWKLRLQVFAGALVVAVILIQLLAPSGYFGPLSSRVRGLFVKHTRTGNPLVDSVAEHQPASSSAYYQYLHYVCYVAPIGFIMILWNFGDAPSFLMLYGAAAYFFSAKMVRLVILLGPIASILGGVTLGRVVAWSLAQFVPFIYETGDEGGKIAESSADENGSNADDAGKKKKKKGGSTSSYLPVKKKSAFSPVIDAVKKAADSTEGRIIKKIIAVAFLALMVGPAKSFAGYCWEMSAALSNPAIMYKARTRSGQTVLVDDYREAYFWLRDNTPEDARILAWWDYGYQITGIGNRTTIADGNTWNHEHIALLGKILTSSEKEGHRIARHLADYVLIWGGGGGDDLAKSPHLARIANSVYRDHCGNNDPTCRAFGFVDRQGTPSKMMGDSLLYKLHSHTLRPGVTADPNRFREVFTSRYGRVRIYKLYGVSKESKEWVADPANRLCDVPGGWFCRGQYPPALQGVLSKKKDFSQLEDFNKRKADGETDEEYTKKYFEDLADPEKARRRAREKEKEQTKHQEKKQAQTQQKSDQYQQDGETSSQPKPRQLTPEQIADVYNTWEDSEESTHMWRLISSNAVEDIEAWLAEDPRVAFLRSSDGRGPMWWAYEFRNEQIVKMLIKAGVSYKDADKYGKTPLDMVAN